MSLSTTSSVVPLFNNYHNVYVYRHLSLKKPDGETDSELQIKQDFENATPELYRDEDDVVWVQPTTKNIPEDLTATAYLSAYYENPVDLDNIYNDNGAENVIGIISGNIRWQAPLPTTYNLQIVANISNIGGQSLSTAVLIPYNADTNKYYIYLVDDGNVAGSKVQFTEDIADTVQIHANIVDATTHVVLQTNFFTTISTVSDYTEITGGTTLTSDAFPYRHIGILHAADVTVDAPVRELIFDGTAIGNPAPFPYKKSTTALIGSTQTMQEYATQAGWPTFITSVNTNVYTITAWRVKDANIAEANYAQAKNFLITDKVGAIVCYPVYTTTTTTKTIVVNKTIKWSAKNTTNKDQSGKFGTMSWTASKPTGIATVYITKAVVDSRNVKLTKTGLNTTTLVQGYKGTNTVQNVTVKVPIVNSKITIYGTWYLQYGSANYLHPGYKNWHNGSGSITISKITY